MRPVQKDPLYVPRVQKDPLDVIQKRRVRRDMIGSA